MALTNALFDPMLNGGAEVAVEASLHTADPGSSGASEVSGGGYARQAVTWAAASGGSIATGAPVVFNVPGSTTITHAGLWTSDGTWLGSLALAAPEQFAAPGTLTVDPMTLTLTN